MKALIIEDESRAAQRLEKLLTKINPNIEIVNKLETIEDSIQFLSNRPKLDLIFSDIQLADGICFEIYENVELTCPIIFTTAYDQYAINAFNTNGIGYLLKPIEEEELKKTLDKVERLTSDDSLRSLKKLTETLLIKQEDYKERFMIKIGEKIISISIDQVYAFFSFEKSSYILTNEGRKYIIDTPIGKLTNRLNPKDFFQINRKYVLSFAACQEIIVYTNSRLRVKLKNLENEYIIVARERVADFKDWLNR